MSVSMENPKHEKYMYEFRINQCEKFIEHKCNFHKPYNCFDWHFPNQRRRVPITLTDGTFNYNPDLYCNSYDQNTGHCPNETDCKYVHMNVGDTERRYHPRYYKTGMCIYETNNDGVCGKNGIHCAFAHDKNDVRQPVYDIRETVGGPSANLSAQLEKDRVLTEDPIWNNMEYVLAYYKTSECRKLPKTCRQGYACPFFHNSKDRRRSLVTYTYQSQPCQKLKPTNEEWQDVAFCNEEDSCQFSHSRTEQQFHPEIFKSSKCNDVLRDNYCPRGPFCAFSHNDEEMNNGQYNTMIQNAFDKFERRRRSNSANQCLSTDTLHTIGHVGGSSVPNHLLSGFHQGPSELGPSPLINPGTLFTRPISGQTSLHSSNQHLLVTSGNNNNTVPPPSTFMSLYNQQLQNTALELLNINLTGEQSSHRSSARSSPASCPVIGTSQDTTSNLIIDIGSQITVQSQQPAPPPPSIVPPPPPPTIETGNNDNLATPNLTNNVPMSPDYNNIKVILERALSSSSNVNKMSDNEIQRLLAQHSQDYVSSAVPSFGGSDISNLTSNLIIAAASNWASPTTNTDSAQQTDLVQNNEKSYENTAVEVSEEDKDKEIDKLRQENKMLRVKLSLFQKNYQYMLQWIKSKTMDSDLKAEMLTTINILPFINETDKSD